MTGLALPHEHSLTTEKGPAAAAITCGGGGGGWVVPIGSKPGRGAMPLSALPVLNDTCAVCWMTWLSVLRYKCTCMHAYMEACIHLSTCVYVCTKLCACGESWGSIPGSRPEPQSQAFTLQECRQPDGCLGLLLFASRASLLHMLPIVITDAVALYLHAGCQALTAWRHGS